MALVTVPECATSAAALLNDQAQSIFTTALLLPYINHAYHDLLFAVDIAQLPLTNEVSAIIQVAIGAITIAVPATPPPFTGMIKPIKIEERAAGSSDQFIPMTEKMWETNVIPVQNINYWAWRKETICIPAATTSREVRVYYELDMDVPLTIASTIPLNRADDFIAHKAAAYAAKLVLQDDIRYENLKNEADVSLGQLIRTLVRSRQSLPTRRRGYGSRWKQFRRYW